MTTQHINDRLGPGGLENVGILSTDTNGNTVLVGADGSAGINDAGLFGASPSATAAVNTAAIQAALDIGGLVTLNTPGTYLINDTLKYGSNTHFRLAPGVIIKQAPNTNKALLVSTALDRYVAGGTTVTPTWTAGTSVSISWPAHGLTAGEACYLWGVTPWVYVGVFKVESVTNANTIVVQMPYTPSAAPTGTMKAIKATQNSIIEGGLWDYDFDNNLIGTALNVHGIALYFTENCHIKKGTQVSNCNKYAAVTCGTLNCTAEIDVPYNHSDGIKVYGPARNTHVLGVTGTCGDDVCSLQNYDSAGGGVYLPYQASNGGELYRVTAKGTNATTNAEASIATLYVNDNIGVDLIEFDGVYGYGGFSAVRIQGQSTANSKAGSVVVRNLAGQGVTNKDLIVDLVTIRKFTLEKWKLNPLAVDTNSLVNFNQNTVINQIEIIDPDINAPGWQSTSNSPAIVSSGIVDHIVMRGVQLDSVLAYTTGLLNLSTGSTARQITVHTGNLKAGGQIVTVSPGLGAAPVINFIGNNIDGPFNLVNVNGPCTINLSANRINNASQGCFRVNATAAVTLNSDGTNSFTGTTIPFSVNTGTLTGTFKGWDLPVAVNATGVNKTAGSYCYNTAAAAGTLVQNRLVTCNGTNWVQVDDPTKIY